MTGSDRRRRESERERERMKQARGQRDGCRPGVLYVYMCVCGRGRRRRAEVEVGPRDQWQVVSGPERLAVGGTKTRHYFIHFMYTWQRRPTSKMHA